MTNLNLIGFWRSLVKVTRSIRTGFVAGLLIVASTHVAWAESYSFQLIDHVQEHHLGTQDRYTFWVDPAFSVAVSADGSVVVGTEYLSRSNSDLEAFRWTAETGTVGLGRHPNNHYPDSNLSTAQSVTADGAKVAGIAESDAFFGGWETVIWTEGSGIVSQSSPPFEVNYSIDGTFISDDGQSVVTTASEFFGAAAHRWTDEGGWVSLGDVAPAPGPFGLPRNQSTAAGLSADGSVVVGTGTSAQGALVREAFRWTNAGGMVGLGDLDGGEFASFGYGVSADGNVVVGSSESALGTEAFRWSAESGMVGLGYLPGGIDSVAYATSADGSVIVGQASTEIDYFGTPVIVPRPFIWTLHDGMRDLTEVLLAGGVADFDGRFIEAATDISDDGRTIVGWSQGNELNDVKFWIATVPEPPSATLAALGIVAMTLYGWHERRPDQRRRLAARLGRVWAVAARTFRGGATWIGVSVSLTILAVTGSVLANSAIGKRVHFVYMSPSDVAYRPDYEAGVENAVRTLHSWFADELGGRTFALNDDIVEWYQTPHDASWYQTNPASSAFEAGRFWEQGTADAFALTGGHFYDADDIWVLYLDANTLPGQYTGGNASVALMPKHDLAGLSGESSTDPLGRWIGGSGHEMGHALLLPHPPGSPGGPHDGSLMWTGLYSFPNTYLREEDRQALLNSGYFDSTIPEPSSLTLVFLGLIGFCMWRRCQTASTSLSWANNRPCRA